MKQILKNISYCLFLALLIACDSKPAEKRISESGPAPLPSSNTSKTASTNTPMNGGEEEEANSNSSSDSEESDEETDQPFISLMLEFKSVLIDEMISKKWTKVAAWEEACGTVTSLSDQAKLLKALETGVEWSAVSPKWQERRTAWIKSCDNASSARDLGRLLAELETNISWESVDQSWRKRRDGWLKECAAL